MEFQFLKSYEKYDVPMWALIVSSTVLHLAAAHLGPPFRVGFTPKQKPEASRDLHICLVQKAGGKQRLFFQYEMRLKVT